MNAILEVLIEMRTRRINHGKQLSPTLLAWADRIEPELRRLLDIEHYAWHLLDNAEESNTLLTIDLGISRRDLDRLNELLPESHPGICTTCFKPFEADVAINACACARLVVFPTQMAADIDCLRDLYLSPTQRAALDHIVKAATE